MCILSGKGETVSQNGLIPTRHFVIQKVLEIQSAKNPSSLISGAAAQKFYLITEARRHPMSNITEPN